MRLHVMPFAILGALLATAPGAAAQSASTGTLVGHVAFCRSIPGPVAAADGDATAPDLRDVTPGFNRPLPRPIRVPAGKILVSVQGTSVNTLTDADGAFTLAGVPAAQPLTLIARVSPESTLELGGAAVSVNPGQTLDLGMLAPAGCGEGSPTFTPSPATAPDTATGSPTTDPDEPPIDQTAGSA